jgi:branched-chain amino acid transport system permease protein
MVNGIQPDDFTISIVFLAIFMPILGGTGTPWGAVLGAAIVVEFTVNIPSFTAGGLLLVSLAVLVVMLVAPQGVLSYLDSGRHFVAGQVRKRGNQ